jgi:hypothetical protein
MYEIDHFLPVILRPDLALDYDNLLYGCASCNLSKGKLRTPDPLTTLTDSQVEVAADETLVTHSPEAAKLAELLGLNRPRLCEFRELWIGIVRLAASCDTSLLQLLLGYPTDLPNLSMLRPPEGNSRPEGVAQSHFSRRRQGELPDLY